MRWLRWLRYSRIVIVARQPAWRGDHEGRY
jgi:hypothetical protein